MPFDKMAPNSKEYATTYGTIIPARRCARCECRARPIDVSRCLFQGIPARNLSIFRSYIEYIASDMSALWTGARYWLQAFRAAAQHSLDTGRAEHSAIGMKLGMKGGRCLPTPMYVKEKSKLQLWARASRPSEGNWLKPQLEELGAPWKNHLKKENRKEVMPQ